MNNYGALSKSEIDALIADMKKKATGNRIDDGDKLYYDADGNLDYDKFMKEIETHWNQALEHIQRSGK